MLGSRSGEWAIVENAPAKINLALHVTGQAPDGYHTLESLVTFADRGDVIFIRPAPAGGFSVSGRFAPLVPATGEGSDGNLVLKARDRLRALYGEAGIETPAVHIHLEKNLPVASGIGGGSADAAATLRALLSLWGGEIEAGKLMSLCLSLGADVPMCLNGTTLIARGIGEDLSPAGTLPALSMILANPLKPVSTPEIFRRLTSKHNPPLPRLPASMAQTDWLAFLTTLRNDLEPPAISLEPEIAQIKEALRISGADLVRMSGSGATCFGIYPDIHKMDAAMRLLEVNHPDWYFLAVQTVAGEEF